MRVRDSIALTLPSFLLRLVLAITFLWAGLGKLVGTYEVSGDDAARLANMGVVLTVIPASRDGDEAAPDPDAEPREPLESLPGSEAQASEPERQEPASEDEPRLPPADDETGTDADTEPGASLSRIQYSGGEYAPSDFPEPVETKRLYSIALLISKAADPGLTERSEPIEPIMPVGLGDGPWPIVLAWSAMLTEIIAGVLLLLGLLTRISALGVFFVMVTAMWITHIGPAAVRANNALLGFIPKADDVWAPGAYSNLLWQFALAMVALAVLFLGSGPIGLDRLFFGSTPRDPYIHGDPKAEKPTRKNPPTRKNQGASASPPRSEFDRSPDPTP